jgi:hypothetical protein
VYTTTSRRRPHFIFNETYTFFSFLRRPTNYYYYYYNAISLEAGRLFLCLRYRFIPFFPRREESGRLFPPGWLAYGLCFPFLRLSSIWVAKPRAIKNSEWRIFFWARWWVYTDTLVYGWEARADRRWAKGERWMVIFVLMAWMFDLSVRAMESCWSGGMKWKAPMELFELKYPSFAIPLFPRNLQTSCLRFPLIFLSSRLVVHLESRFVPSRPQELYLPISSSRISQSLLHSYLTVTVANTKAPTKKPPNSKM